MQRPLRLGLPNEDPEIFIYMLAYFYRGTYQLPATATTTIQGMKQGVIALGDAHDDDDNEYGFDDDEEDVDGGDDTHQDWDDEEDEEDVLERVIREWELEQEKDEDEEEEEGSNPYVGTDIEQYNANRAAQSTYNICFEKRADREARRAAILRTHLRVYVLAARYGVSSLRVSARDRFQRSNLVRMTSISTGSCPFIRCTTWLLHL